MLFGKGTFLLDELNTLRLIAETGSLQAAGHKRGLTQSAITRQIQRLEDALGAELLDRDVKPARLTRIGEEVLARGQIILAAVEELKSCIAPGTVPTGALRIGLAHGLSQPSVAEPIQQLRRRLPQVFPSFHTNLSANLLERVRDGRLDAAVVLHDRKKQLPPGMLIKTIGREHISVVRAATTGNDGDKALKDAYWVVNPEGCKFRNELNSWSEKWLGQPVRIAAEAHDIGLQTAFVMTGLGYGLMSQRTLRHYPSAQRLEVIAVRGLSLTADVLVARGRGLGPMNNAVDCLEEELGKIFEPVNQKS